MHASATGSDESDKVRQAQHSTNVHGVPLPTSMISLNRKGVRPRRSRGPSWGSLSSGVRASGGGLVLASVGACVGNADSKEQRDRREDCGDGAHEFHSVGDGRNVSPGKSIQKP